MDLPKYTVCKFSTHEGMRWGIFQGRKRTPLAAFATRDEAQTEAQRMVEDDRWHAANR